MPKLLLFAPCENVLISQGEAASLIVVLHQLQLIGVPEDLPPNSAVPLKWHIFTQWEIMPEEEGATCEQKVELLDFSGSVQGGLQNLSEFTCDANKQVLRIIGSFTFFPLVPGGQYRLRLYVRRLDHEDWITAGDYPLQIIYVR